MMRISIGTLIIFTGIPSNMVGSAAWLIGRIPVSMIMFVVDCILRIGVVKNWPASKPENDPNDAVHSVHHILHWSCSKKGLARR